MSTIPALEIAAATPDAQATLAAVNAMLGVTPNLFRVAANAPAALDALVQMSGTLAKGRLRARARESIALAVAQLNGCDYCLSAHAYLGKGAGLSDDDVLAARSGEATDPKTRAILALTAAIVRSAGGVDAEALENARTAGLSAGEIVEVVAHVALNVFTNYLNKLAGTEIDFPVVRAAELATV